MFAAEFKLKMSLVKTVRFGLTFDVPVKFPLAMKVLESPKKFADNDSDVFLSEYSWFHLTSINRWLICILLYTGLPGPNMSHLNNTL